MNERMNEWTNERMKEWTNERMNEWMNEPMNKWTNEWMNQWTNEPMNQWKKERNKQTNKQTNKKETKNSYLIVKSLIWVFYYLNYQYRLALILETSSKKNLKVFFRNLAIKSKEFHRQIICLLCACFTIVHFFKKY
jgi:hypothetical protein